MCIQQSVLFNVRLTHIHKRILKLQRAGTSDERHHVHVKK